jgi:uncharacterized Zn finger protein (UPF0148 family)
MATTHCTNCARTIGYGGATVCPYCGKPIAKSPQVSAPSVSARPIGAVAPKLAASVTAAAAAGPAVPERASRALRQLRAGLERLMKALRGEAGLVEVELAVAEIAVALALLRAVDRWDVAEAGLGEALREFLAYAPADDARGKRLRELQERLRGWFGDSSAARIAVGNTALARDGRVVVGQALRTSSTSLLALVDGWTVEEFDLERVQRGPLQSPTIYCETFEDFYGSFFAFRNLSPEEQARGVREESERARAALAADGGAVLGVNWPGRGCFLNGEAFAGLHDKRDAAEALRCPATFPHILSTAVHEKLGHGWLTECTARGQEIRSVHLEQHEVARHFLRQASDDPRDVLLQDKWNLLLGTSKYAEEGYATWIESKVLALAAKRVAAGATVDERGVALEDAANAYPAELVVERLRDSGDEACRDLADAIDYLVRAGPAERRELAVLMGGVFPHTDLGLGSAERDEHLDTICSELFGQPLHYVVGFVLVEKLEQRFGARSVPFALALAGNVSYGLETISNADLRVALDSHPYLRMDARLAALGTLEGVPHDDPDALYMAARRELSLTPPSLGPRKARR